MGYFTYLSPSVFSHIYLMKDHPFQMPLRQGCVSAMDPTQDSLFFPIVSLSDPLCGSQCILLLSSFQMPAPSATLPTS